MRKSIRIKGYDYSKEGMYYVTICTQSRKHILGNIMHVGAPAHRCPENTKIKINLSKEGKIVEKYLKNINIMYENIELEKYVIMPNHVHFIINIKTGHLWAGAPTKYKPITIAQIINSLKTITSKQIGYSIWQRNYYEHIIRNEKELYKIIEYIEFNPLKWKNT